MDAQGIIAFAYEAGQLKRMPRAGWQLAGVANPESVAAHSYRVGVLAYVIAALEGANADRAAALGLFHDLPEARIGDVPSVGKPYVKTADPRDVVADQVTGLPDDLAVRITSLIREHEDAKTAASTLEARCSRDADKIECLITAREYQAAGNHLVQPWVDTMVAAVTTDTGKQLAAAAQEVGPGVWWAEFAAQYGQLRRRGIDDRAGITDNAVDQRRRWAQDDGPPGVRWCGDRPAWFIGCLASCSWS